MSEVETGPIYPRKNAALPVVDESDLDAVGVGLYRVRDKFRYGDIYDPVIGELLIDAPSVMLARVDDGQTYLPVGVLRAEIRPDGKRLVVGWVVA